MAFTVVALGIRLFGDYIDQDESVINPRNSQYKYPLFQQRHQFREHNVPPHWRDDHCF
jgi:hypothetical protein